MRSLKSRAATAAVALAVLATPALAASPPVTIRPGQSVTLSLKVTKRAPRGWYWWFSVVSLNKTQKHCATFAYKILRTRGTVGHTLRATLAPTMDVLRHRPSRWCSGRMAGEAQIDSYADRNFRHSKLIALRWFRVS